MWISEMQLSIIIPTHNRAATLPRTLQALARQTVASVDYQVILVADGCEDGTAELVRRLTLPYQITLLEQDAVGAATARNRGAAAATAPLLLFLDDDMEALPELIEAHLAAHREHPDSVVLGYFPVATHAQTTDLFELSSALWWADEFKAREQPEHRFTFRDLCSGNFSLPRQLFDRVGGFDDQFGSRAGEDYELGVRLLKQRARLLYARGAASLHHDLPTVRRSFARAQANGRGHVVLIRKHPELFSVLPIGWPPSGSVLRPLWHLLWRQPKLARRIVYVLELLLAVARSAKLRGQWQRLYGCVHGYWYWRGIQQELGSLSSWRRLAQDAPIEPQAFCEIEVDLETDLPYLDKLLQEQPVDAVRVRYGETLLGRVEPVIGAEALRIEHMRRELIYRFGTGLLGSLLLEQAAKSTPFAKELA